MDDEVVWAWVAAAIPSTATKPRIAVRISMVIDPSNRSGRSAADMRRSRTGRSYVRAGPKTRRRDTVRDFRHGRRSIYLLLETEGDAGVEFELIRILRITHDVAAPVRVAPPAFGVGLDVGRRPARTEANARVVARIELHARADRAGELRVPTKVPA